MENDDIALLKNLTILYAEDDPLIQESITRVLEYFFGKVLSASNGVEALEIYKTIAVDVLLLDYVMPVLSGYDVASTIRQNDKTIPIIIASGFTDKEKLLSAIPLNLVEYIEKPIMYENLKLAFGKVVQILLESNKLFMKINEKFEYSYINKSIFKIATKQEIHLTKKEYEFFELMLSRQNQLVSKDLIEEVVFKDGVDENALRNMIYRVRKKLDGENVIITIKDLGYMLSVKN